MKSKSTAWKRRILRFVGLLVVLSLGGLMLAATGIVPIKASSGHWAITRWFLQFSKSRSIATHTIGLEVPSLDDPRQILKGAGHYEMGCAPCHGSPVRPQPRVAEHMLPPPPSLKDVYRRRDDAELFYIVKHGLKFTGMPAWPAADRDDEVWSMVAFLRQLPELDSRRYQELAIGEVTSNEGLTLDDLPLASKMPRLVVENCTRCHGVDGLGRGTGAFPKLASQTSEYISASLEAYARRERHSGIMGPIAASLSRDAIDELARYYAHVRPSRGVSVSVRDADAVARGREIALNGIAQRRVPPCVECHGPRPGPRNPHYPALAGQYSEYVILQLQLFRQQHRGGTRFSHLMHFVAGHLTLDQMRDVAMFFESLAGPNGTLTIR